MDAERKTCAGCGRGFEIGPDENSWYDRLEIPVPGECPRCRQQRRMTLRNFKTLYKRKSDKSGESIISMYSDKAPFPVWSHGEWWSDDWDPLDYGKEFDFSRPFFEQYRELLQVVPRFSVMNTNSPDSQYTNMTYNSKGCYLVFGCVDDEECAYGHIVWESKDCLDCLYVYKSELCYECTDVLGSYRLFHSQECEDCADSIGLYDCRGCTNCIGCVGLRQKSYYVFNKPAGKKQYEEFLKSNPVHKPETLKLIRERTEELKRKIPRRHFFGSHNSDVSGNHIYNGKDLHNVFDIKGGEHSRYVYTGRRINDSMDVSFTVDVEKIYQSMNSANSSDLAFAEVCIDCSDVWYSQFCFNTRHAFGCAGCKGMEYAILNKRYDKENFESLKKRIIAHMKETGEWGKYFPPSISPFGYNETIAQEYIPLSRQEAENKGFRWEEDIPRTSGQETRRTDELPSNPEDYTEKLCEEILACDACSYNFRLIPKEIRVCKQSGLPLPKECFNCRHDRRMQLRDPRILRKKTCSQCGKDIMTSIRAEDANRYRVLCSDCYQADIV